MNNIPSTASGNISVADITIAQLSRGLYRSTATAFKELVSNAYDADATVVRIDTNYPEFDFISCVDNGTGMPIEKFLRFFDEEGIGSSIKRKGGKIISDVYQRPLIGRLGIGMLAVGQLCHSFEIESHYKDDNDEGKAYRASIILEDEGIPKKDEIVLNEDSKTKEIEVGKWSYEIIDYDKTKEGFRIYSTDVRQTFRREMKSSIGEKEFSKISFSLSDLHTEFYDKAKKSIRDCKPYLETIWEMSILCPLPYYGEIDEYPINTASFKSSHRKTDDFNKAFEFIKERQQKFLNENFRVVFDGIELRRFVQLPTTEDVIPQLFLIEFDDDVFESRLKFAGYIFAQIPRAVRPLELNGIQIRLRGVGIGGYDSTFLKYYNQIETIRNKWVSGEIFVDDGLESALNIDRDSFNEHDEHFKKLQSSLHNRLNDIFNQIDKLARKRSEGRREVKEKESQKSMQAIVAEESNGRIKLVQQDLGKDRPNVEVDKKQRKIILNISKNKKIDAILKAVMVAYYTAILTSNTEEQRDHKFHDLVKKILGELV